MSFGSCGTAISPTMQRGPLSHTCLKYHTAAGPTTRQPQSHFTFTLTSTHCRTAAWPSASSPPSPSCCHGPQSIANDTSPAHMSPEPATLQHGHETTPATVLRHRTPAWPYNLAKGIPATHCSMAFKPLHPIPQNRCPCPKATHDGPKTLPLLFRTQCTALRTSRIYLRSQQIETKPGTAVLAQKPSGFTWPLPLQNPQRAWRNDLSHCHRDSVAKLLKADGTHLTLLSFGFSLALSLSFSIEISTFSFFFASLLFYCNCYLLFHFAFRCALSLYFSRSTFSFLFPSNLYFLLSLLFKSLHSLYSTIEVSHHLHF